MLALYRKWRPKLFSEVIGQEHVKTTLVNALLLERLSHAYLFSGPKGSGKTTVARLLAKGANCQNFQNGEPCLKCPFCLEIQKGESLDLIEIDAASNRGIEEIKDLREKIKFAPAKSKYKVYIIDECHMLTREAFNALLKTLEEPPSFVIFILVTTEVHKIPPTILSRCQRFDFRRLTNSEIIERLSFILKGEKIPYQKKALELIAQKSEGSARDAESLLDLILSKGIKDLQEEEVKKALGKTQEKRIEELFDFLKKGETKEALLLIQEIQEEGENLHLFCQNLIEFLREKLFQDYTLASWIKILLEAQREMKTSPLVQLPLELAIVEIAQKTPLLKDDPAFENTLDLDWNKVISKIKPKNHSLCFLLQGLKPTVSDDKIVLFVDFPFFKDKIEKPENKKIIEKAIFELLGRHLEIECQVLDRPAKSLQSLPSDNNLLKETKEIFEVEDA